MKISELSELSGVPVATVKFYIREGMLARGEAFGHARRVRRGAPRPAAADRGAGRRAWLAAGARP